MGKTIRNSGPYTKQKKDRRIALRLRRKKVAAIKTFALDRMAETPKGFIHTRKDQT